MRKLSLNMCRSFLFVTLIAIASAACGLGPDMTRDRIPRSPSPTPWQGEIPIQDYIREGDAAYQANNYRGAVEPYKRAMEIEQRQPQLDKKQWYALVNNLATSYASTGDVTNARVLLAYGISKDFKYPMFHYILARTYGDEGNEGEALRHLRNAYYNKRNIGPGEKLPDPLEDSSFANFADNEVFKKAIADMKAGRVK